MIGPCVHGACGILPPSLRVPAPCLRVPAEFLCGWLVVCLARYMSGCAGQLVKQQYLNV